MLPIPPDTLLQQRYRILNMLGEGGFGRTYLATDRARANAAERSEAEEFCEIQEFIPTSQIPGAVAKAKEFFKQQAILLYQLQHPQVPRFWATFEEQGRLFLVLDYIEGKTYGQILAERRDAGGVFSETEVWQLLLQVVPVLGYIHSKGVIHREVSPENIICRSSDRLPVLSDFGAVKEFADKLHANSGTSLHSGKPYYAPSEQLTSGKLYPSSDFHALAVTAIVLLTGKEASALFTDDRMNWDWRKWTQISDGLADVLQRMLAPDPNVRYQAAIEIYRDLQALVMPTNEPVAAPPPLGARPSELPTVAVGATPPPEAPKRPQTAITPVNTKSIWEKPQVFIPLGILISLLAGLGSWLGVGYFLRNKPSEQTATTPPKQIDFNNPTIPTDSIPSGSSTDASAADTIQPALEREVVKEGTVDATKPIRYKFAATSGQNLDIQLLSSGSSSSSPTAIISPLPGIPSAVPTQSPTSGQTASPSIAPITPTQVLLSVLSPTGSPVDSQADRVVGWRGQISTDGEYTIELRPIAGLSGKAYPYKLSVTQLASLPSTTPSSSPESVVPSIAPTSSPDSGIPATSPTSSPDSSTPTTSPESVIPSTGSTPPLNIPVPSGSSGVDSTPSTPTPSPSDTPTVAPSNNTSTSSGSTRRTRRRRIRQTQTEPSPQVTQQRQVDSSNNATSRRRRRRVTTDSSTENTTTRRRTQVESNTTQTSTTRSRRRRNRVANTNSTRSTQTTTPKSETSESNSIPNGVPIEVPSPNPEPIAVPSPRTNSVPSSGDSNGSN